VTVSDEAQLIDPSGIPHFIGDLATLDTDVMLLTADAGQFRASGANVHTTFQQLSAFYSAPEAEQLFGTTLPVRTKSDAFADDLEKVANALSDYSLEVQPLVKKLDALKAEATAFVHSVAGDDDWRKDQDKVDHNNDLWHDVNHTVAAFQAAELRAYNRIMALIGGTALTTDDGSHGKNMYGYAAADLDQAEATPWGAPVEREYEGWSWLAHQGKQVWDGVWHDGVMGTVHGLGTLAGWDGADAAGEAWKNLAKLGTGVGMTLGTLGTWGWVPDEDLPSWLRDSRTVLNQTAKGFVAWDQWKTNPGRAAGAFGFNALTVLGTGGTGAAASGTGKAAATVRVVSVVGKTSRAIDPMTYVGKAGKFAFTKVGDTFTALKNLHTPDLLKQPQAARSPKIPANAIPYLDHTTGKIVYLTDEGHLLNTDGSIRQRVDEATHELSSNDRVTLDASGRTDHAHEPAGVGARAEHTTDVTRTGEEPAGRGGRGGGHAASHEGASARAAEESSQRPPIGNAGHGHGSSGAAHGDSAGRHGDAPERQPTPEEQRKVIEKQVKKANEDPEWYKRYYYEDGRRKSIYTKDENENYLPQLKKDANGRLIAADDAPRGPQEAYRLGKVELDRTSVTLAHKSDLDEIAHIHHSHSALNHAENSFEENPSLENAHALEKARENFGDHPRNSKIGAELGEKSAALHAIPKLFHDAVLVEDLPKSANGAHEFDQIYRLKESGDLLIVEAKAPEGRLEWRWGEGTDTGRKVKQGTAEYVRTIADLMEARGGKEASIGAEIKRALRRKKGLQYVLVQAAPHNGKYAGAVVKYFKIF
jgi:hypothetical protein